MLDPPVHCKIIRIRCSAIQTLPQLNSNNPTSSGVREVGSPCTIAAGKLPVSPTTVRLRRHLPLCPPFLHHRRQFLAHSRTHRLAGRGFLLGWHRLFWSGCTLLPRPTCSLRYGNPGPCRCTHATTFPATNCFRLARLRRTTPACGLGTRSNESCNCLFDTASFLPKLCHYALNVHLVPFSIAISGPAV